MSSLHKIIGRRAFELLPANERAFWKDEAENIPHYCEYPDLHAGAPWDEPEMEKHYEKYCLMPCGRCTPHGPSDATWRCAAFGGEPRPENSLYTIQYYIRRVAALIRGGEPREAAMFAGTVAHTVQDFCTPVHTFSNIILNRTFPPIPGRHIFMHRAVDGWPFSPELVTEPPELLGRSIREAAFLLNERLFANMEWQQKHIVPLFESIRSGRTKRADAIMQETNAAAVHLTASLWHTMFAIAWRRFPAAEGRRLDEIDLAALPMIESYSAEFNRDQYIDAGIPFYPNKYEEYDPHRSRLGTDPYPFEPAVNHALANDGSEMPLELVVDGKPFRGNGHGIATAANGVASFREPGSLYATLDVFAGIHPRSESDRIVTFGVWCNESSPKLLCKFTAGRDTPAVHLNIPIPKEARTLSLLSAGGDQRLHAIWLNPIIRRR
ncbi:MAG: hypothetical protein J5833_09140 [Victivallales bacterium]|nr:hypothetical protein [Victivallales bacterium]